jgi:hypothetical protein
MSLGKLAELLGDKGDYDAAEPLYRESVDIFEKTLPPNHPHIHASLSRLASLLREMGRDAEAEELETRLEAVKAEGAGGG